MKKIVPFSKTIQFKTMISEITELEVKHNLELKEFNEVEGDILVDGKYKITSASQIEEEFHYKLPFVIAIDSKYDTENLDINIDNFNYEIINEEELKIDVEVALDNIYEKELTRFDTVKIPIEMEEEKDKLEVLDTGDFEDKEKNTEIEIEKEEKTKKEEKETNIGSIFSNLTKTEETFSTYHVYIVRENDTIESILDKYNISRDELADYNDLDDIKLGTKLIIPCSNE